MTTLDKVPAPSKNEKPPNLSSLQRPASVTTASYFSGPIPPPDFLEKYETL
jgi:hypothetical protein